MISTILGLSSLSKLEFSTSPIAPFGTRAPPRCQPSADIDLCAGLCNHSDAFGLLINESYCGDVQSSLRLTPSSSKPSSRQTSPHCLVRLPFVCTVPAIILPSSAHRRVEMVAWQAALDDVEIAAARTCSIGSINRSNTEPIDAQSFSIARSRYA
jgi:hypothetical protein